MPRKTARGASSSNTNTSPKRALGSLEVVEVDVEEVVVKRLKVLVVNLVVMVVVVCGVSGSDGDLW